MHTLYLTLDPENKDLLELSFRVDQIGGSVNTKSSRKSEHRVTLEMSHDSVSSMTWLYTASHVTARESIDVIDGVVEVCEE